MVHFSTLLALPFLLTISALVARPYPRDSLDAKDDEARENEKVGDDFVKLKLPNWKNGANFCMSKVRNPAHPDQAYGAVGEDCSTAPEVRMQLDGTTGKIKIKYEDEEKTVLQVLPKTDKGVWDTYWARDDDSKAEQQSFAYNGHRIQFKGTEVDGQSVDEQLCLGLHYHKGTDYFIQLDPCTEGADPQANVEGAVLQDWRFDSYRKADGQATSTTSSYNGASSTTMR